MESWLHRSTLLFQLRDWRESLATSTAAGHGLHGELFIRFIVKEGLIPTPGGGGDSHMKQTGIYIPNIPS